LLRCGRTRSWLTLLSDDVVPSVLLLHIHHGGLGGKLHWNTGAYGALKLHLIDADTDRSHTTHVRQG
jgi:hypothetical protein